EAARRALPRALRSRRIAAGVVACGVAASVASWTSAFQVNAQAMFQPQMDQFRAAIASPRAVLLDQFSFINFFSHYHDWQWRAGGDFPGTAVRQLWSVTSGDRRMAVCREATQWSFDLGSVNTFDAVIECAHKTGVNRVSIFRTHWWDSPPGLAVFKRDVAQADGLTPLVYVPDGDDVSA